MVNREKLKQVVLDHAFQTLKEKGVAEIRIRSLAKASDCAVGSIYNLFDDLDDILFHLNLRALKELFYMLHTNLEDGIKAHLSIEEILPRLGWVYIDFGRENYHLWKSIFESAPASKIPSWYQAEIAKNMRQFEKILQEGYQLSEEKATQLINYFWFAIHGVSSILLNRKATDHSEDFLNSYVNHCLRGIQKFI